MAEFQLTITGSGWTALVKAARLDHPVQHIALRNVFAATADPLTPNLAVLCAPLNITIHHAGSDYKFTPPRFDLPQTLPELEAALRDGKAAMLLLAGDANSLSTGGKFACLAGRLHTLAAPSSDPLRKLCADLGLEPPDGLSAQSGGPWVEASGVYLRARVPLPWQADKLTALLLLADGELSLRNELLDTTERLAAVTAWRNLGRVLAPAKGSAFVALELSAALPEWRWLVPTGRPPRKLDALHLPPDAARLLLSDANLEQRPTTLAHVLLSEISLRGVAGRFSLDVAAGSQAPPSSWLDYEYDRDAAEILRASAADGEPFLLAFDPIEFPASLRNDLGLPEPALGVELEQPLLWANLRLEDGWLQAPTPNLSAQLYDRAGLYQTSPSPESASPLFQGAVALGNRHALEQGLARDEQHWELILADATGLKGRWEIADQTVKAVRMNIGDPHLLLSGLLWVGRQAPSAEDALPSLDNWIGGLRPVALRPVRRGLPLRFSVATERGSVPETLPLGLDVLALPQGGEDDVGGVPLQSLLHGPMAAWEAMFAAHELPIGLLRSEVRNPDDDTWILNSGEQGVTATIRRDGEVFTLHRDGADPFPSLLRFELRRLMIEWKDGRNPSLADWSLTQNVQLELLQQLRTHKVFPATLSDTWPAPIVWRRHPRLPLVQG